MTMEYITLIREKKNKDNNENIYKLLTTNQLDLIEENKRRYHDGSEILYQTIIFNANDYKSSVHNVLIKYCKYNGDYYEGELSIIIHILCTTLQSHFLQKNTIFKLKTDINYQIRQQKKKNIHDTKKKTKTILNNNNDNNNYIRLTPNNPNKRKRSISDVSSYSEDDVI